MSWLKRSYTRLLNIGIDSSTPIDKALKIKIVNGVAAFCFIIMLITSCIILFMILHDKSSVADLNKA